MLPTDAEIEPRRLHTLLLAYHRLLTADTGLASRLDWSSASLSQFRRHPDAGTRLLAVQVLCKQRGLSEAKRMAMEVGWVGDVSDVDAKIYYGKEVVSTSGISEIQEVWVDGWLLPIKEVKREESCTSSFLKTSLQY